MNVAFVADSRASFGIDRHIALNVMRIHVVRSHADWTQRFVDVTKMTLGDNEIALHSSCFANIKLFGPVPVINEFVFSESPCQVLFTNVFRHAFVVLKRPKEPLLPVAMRFVDGLAFFIRAVWIVIVAANVVSGNRLIVIGVRLVVRHRREGHKDFLTGFNRTEKKLVIEFVIILRLFDRNHVLRIVRQAHTQAVCLNEIVRFAVFRVDFFMHEGK